MPCSSRFFLIYLWFWLFLEESIETNNELRVVTYGGCIAMYLFSTQNLKQ